MTKIFLIVSLILSSALAVDRYVVSHYKVGMTSNDEYEFMCAGATMLGKKQFKRLAGRKIDKIDTKDIGKLELFYRKRAFMESIDDC